MIKKLRVTVDGTTYDVTVELPDETGSLPATPLPVAPPAAAAPVSAPVLTTAPQPAAASVPVVGSPGVVAAGDVPSPLAGRVTAIVVKLGQPIKSGEHLLTLEAMKMNTFVFAPKSGTISEIKVAVGDAVEEGQPLVRVQ